MAKQLWTLWATMQAKHSGRVQLDHTRPIRKIHSAVSSRLNLKPQQICFGSLMGHPFLGTRRELHKPNSELRGDAQKESNPAASPVGKRKLGGANPFAKKAKAVAAAAGGTS